MGDLISIDLFKQSHVEAFSTTLCHQSLQREADSEDCFLAKNAELLVSKLWPQAFLMGHSLNSSATGLMFFISPFITSLAQSLVLRHGVKKKVLLKGTYCACYLINDDNDPCWTVLKAEKS